MRALPGVKLLCGLLLAHCAAFGQLSTSILYVSEPVEVRDLRGNPVDNLSAEDFTLTENGVAQRFVVCKYQNLQAPEQVSRQAAPGQISPTPPRELAYNGRRLLAFYFDLVGMPERDRSRSLSAARTFLAGLLQPADLVAIVDYNEDEVRILEDFTDDRARLLHDIDKLSDPDAPASPTRTAETVLSPANEHIAALRLVERMLGTVTDQKVLIWFTPGRNFQATTNLAEVQATVNAAVSGNVSVHPIVIGETNRATLGSLTAATGGAISLDEDDLTAALQRAQASVRNHYVVFYGTVDDRSGPRRQIEITVAGRQDLSLSYRQAFYTPQAPRRVPIEEQLATQLARPDPVVELPFALDQSSSPLKNGEFSTTLIARIPNAQLTLIYQKSVRRQAPVLEFIGELRNRSLAEVAPIRDSVSFPMTDTNGAIDRKKTSEYRMDFMLAAGDYTIKLVAIDAYHGAVGTYWLNFTVPH